MVFLTGELHNFREQQNDEICFIKQSLASNMITGTSELHESGKIQISKKSRDIFLGSRKKISFFLTVSV